MAAVWKSNSQTFFTETKLIQEKDQFKQQTFAKFYKLASKHDRTK